MRKSLFALLLLAVCATASAQIVKLGSSIAASTNGGASVSVTSDVTGASLAVACVTFYKASTGYSVTFNGVAGTLAKEQLSANSAGASIWYWVNPTGSHAFAASGGSETGYFAISPSWYSGTATSSVVDATDGAANNGGSTNTGGTVAPANPGELVLSCLGLDGGTGTAAANLTALDSLAASGGNSYQTVTAYSIQTTATSVTPSWSWTPGPNSNAAATVSFNAAPAVPTSGNFFGLMQ